MRDSKIAWTHHTFNPWRGCTKVSAGCANCYAEKLSHRNPAVLGEWGPDGKRVPAAESYWKQPLRWHRSALERGVRERVFCASLADVFEERADLAPLRRRLGDLILATRGLDWLLLTKRPGAWMAAVREMFPEQMLFPPNVWVGASVETQGAADARIPDLLRVPVPIRFVSYEPALGPVDFGPYVLFEKRAWRPLNWVIFGGESGASDTARTCALWWALQAEETCRLAGVPFFMKQYGRNPYLGFGQPVALKAPKGDDPAEWPVSFVQQFPFVSSDGEEKG